MITYVCMHVGVCVWILCQIPWWLKMVKNLPAVQKTQVQ